MDWDKNAAGLVVLSPLVDYQVASLMGMGCGLRLRLARPEDGPETPATAVQVGMSVHQAISLARDILKITEQLLEPPQSQPPN